MEAGYFNEGSYSALRHCVNANDCQIRLCLQLTRNIPILLAHEIDIQLVLQLEKGPLLLSREWPSGNVVQIRDTSYPVTNETTISRR